MLGPKQKKKPADSDVKTPARYTVHGRSYTSKDVASIPKMGNFMHIAIGKLSSLLHIACREIFVLTKYPSMQRTSYKPP